MLLCTIFLFTRSCKYIALTSEFVPEQPFINSRRIELNNNKQKKIIPDIFIFEESKQNNLPKGVPKTCQFHSSLPTYYIYQKNEITQPLAEVPQTLSGYMGIARELFRNNISVALFSFNATYKFSNSAHDNIDGYHLADPNTAFPFLKNVKISFSVFSKFKPNDIPNICQRPRHIVSPNFFILLMLTIYVLIVFLHFSRNIFPYKFDEKVNCWIVNPNGNVISGDSLDNVDPFHRNFVFKALNQAKLQENSVVIPIKMQRRKEYQSFYSAFCTPYGDNYLVCLCDELFTNNDNRGFNIEFHSQNVYFKDTPKVRALSLLNCRPLEIECMLTNNITCQYFLPGTVLVPFQPNGKIYSIVISMFFKLTNQVSNNILVDSVFPNMITEVCKHFGINRAFFFANDSLVHGYCADDKKLNSNTLKTSVYSHFETKSVPFRVENLIDEKDLCYFNEITEIKIIFQFTRPVCYAFIETAAPIISLCCAHIYRLTCSKEQSLQLSRISSLFAASKSYSLLERSDDDVKIICTDKSMTDKDFYPQIIEEINSSDKQFLQHITQLKTENPTWISLSSETSFYPITNATITTFFVEEVTSLKEHELSLSKSLTERRHVMNALNIRQFNIIDGKVQMTDDGLFKDLKVDAPENLYLEPVIHPKDVGKILVDKSMIRIINSDDKPLWYVSLTNGNMGFVFNVSDMITIRSRLETSDKGLQLSATSSSLIFWTVDPIHDSVNSLFMQPTIWDVLSVDRDTKFSRFADFLFEEDRQVFVENYRSLVEGRVHQWTGYVRLLRISGTYEWHRLVFALSRTQTLHCLALDVNTQKENELKLRETQKLRDLLLSSGKLTLWKFNDDYEPYEHIHNFDPNVMKVVEMNWTFVNSQVREDYRDEFYETMQHAYECDECIAMSVPLLLDEEIWVSVRGKARSCSRQVVGVCIDITELRKAYSDLEKEKKRAEEANKQKTVFLANMSHEIRTPMNGIFGILDVLALKNLSSEQRQLVELIRASSTQLMKLLDDTLNLSKIEQGDIESNPAIFDFGQLIEPICVATASRAMLNNVKLNVIISKDFPFLVFGDSQLFLQILNNLLSNALKFTKKGHIDVVLGWTDEDEIEFLSLEVADSGIGITKEQKKVIFHRFQQADATTARFFGGTGLGLALVQEIARFLGGSVKVKSKFGMGARFIVELPFESIYRPFSPAFFDGRKHVVMISTIDEILKRNLAEWIGLYHYEVVSFDEAQEIDRFLPEIIIVESQKNLCSEIDKKDIKAIKCAICRAGESSIFKTKLTSPLMPHRLYEFLSECRYRKIEQVAAVKVSKIDQTKRRILVVEDNKTNQFVMSKILSNSGCTFEIADNGKDAISILENKTNGFDLIFMDCQMPVLDGITATKLIREANKPYSKIPIVALTASAVEGDEETCLSAGMNAYLAKPVRYQQVTDMIKKFT